MERKIYKQVKLKDIVFDKELYPRENPNWLTAYNYSENMKQGAIFPPITLALFKKKLYLIDGKHRVDAKGMLIKDKNLNDKKLQSNLISAEVYIGWDMKRMFEEAIKRNIAHGKALSPYEKRKIALKLRGMSYADSEISGLIQVPLGRLNNFVAQRLTSTLTGEAIVKNPMRHFAKEGFNMDLEDLEEQQSGLEGSSQITLLNDLIYLFENNLIDFQDKVIVRSIKKLKTILQGI
jgi:hypothetical protein